MKPYQPDNLPLDNRLDYKRLLPLVGRANAALARYTGMLQGIPSPSVMLSPLTDQEATLSSRIEGTQATLDEVFKYEAGSPDKEDKYYGFREIINYRTALREGHAHLRESRPLSLHLVRQLHGLLMEEVRGQDKTPGAFRTTQNHIGRPGSTIAEASFVPPEPLVLKEHLQAWEQYMASDDLDPLLQTAVMHAQFEILHPFNDGNGRVGRMLIPLFLHYKKALAQPVFYLSEYLEKHRQAYYRHLLAISDAGAWSDWVAFFLNAVAVQAETNTRKVAAIQNLHKDMQERVRKITHSQYIVYILDAIFSKPIFSVPNLARQMHRNHGVNRTTVSDLLRSITTAGILDTIRPGRGGRATILCFTQLMRIINDKA